MYNVTSEQVDFILDDIGKRGVKIEDVKLNILDHVCCIIENEMPNEGDFFEFYQMTIARFYHKELGEIEAETQKLLTFKNFYAMKRTLKISGIATILLIVFGVVFKSMHWPGAGIFVVLSLAFFSLVFIPLNIVLKFKDDEVKSNRLIMTLGMLTASAGSIGALFKIMHWPMANIILFSSLLVFMLVFIPIYFVVRYRDPETKFNAIINTTFMIGAAGILFALIDLGYSKKTMDTTHKVEIHQFNSDSTKRNK